MFALRLTDVQIQKQETQDLIANDDKLIKIRQLQCKRKGMENN